MRHARVHRQRRARLHGGAVVVQLAQAGVRERVVARVGRHRDPRVPVDALEPERASVGHQQRDDLAELLGLLGRVGLVPVGARQREALGRGPGQLGDEHRRARVVVALHRRAHLVEDLEHVLRLERERVDGDVVEQALAARLVDLGQRRPARAHEPGEHDLRARVDGEDGRARGPQQCHVVGGEGLVGPVEDGLVGLVPDLPLADRAHRQLGVRGPERPVGAVALHQRGHEVGVVLRALGRGVGRTGMARGPRRREGHGRQLGEAVRGRLGDDRVGAGEVVLAGLRLHRAPRHGHAHGLDAGPGHEVELGLVVESVVEQGPVGHHPEEVRGHLRGARGARHEGQGRHEQEDQD